MERPGLAPGPVAGGRAAGRKELLMAEDVGKGRIGKSLGARIALPGIALAGIAAAAIALAAAGDSALAGEPSLAEVRAATERFRDVKVALEIGRASCRERV